MHILVLWLELCLGCIGAASLAYMQGPFASVRRCRQDNPRIVPLTDHSHQDRPMIAA